MIQSKDAVSTAVAENLATFPESKDGSPGKAKGPRQKKKQFVEGGLEASTDVGRRGSPKAPVSAGDDAEKAARPTSSVAAGYDEPHGRAVRALPLVRRRRRRRRNAGDTVEEDATGGVWFDKTILRVGVRVPWGRLHRGRFAKVLFPHGGRRSEVFVHVDGHVGLAPDGPGHISDTA